MAGLRVPLSTLRRRPCDRQRMTRGRDGWLGLSRVTLAFTTPRRSPGALSVLSTLGIWVCARRSIAPRRARVQRRGRPISEKALVILDCEEAFENTELSSWNDR